jgi:nucleotide-binding universal stress UspA family protein
MFRTVLWATDGSETADRALPYVKELVDNDGRIVVFHVRELLVGRAGGQAAYADEPEVESRIVAQAEELRAEGFAVTLKVCSTFDVNAGHAIAATANAVGADAVVLGTRGRSPFASVLHGSVTQHLLHEAACPVFAVPPLAALREPALV